MEGNHIPLEELLDASSGSVYKLTILAAKRALQLADGDKPLVEKPSEKALTNALREIRDEKVKVNNKK
ncbi:MAG: DNA-directed RNA polymerase subunit omega [Candidatus Omnitrophota bacterium]|nr:MAG: DNA-directed RNA polymerase subunit omega [Candidatus Omnitrophota bacterium]